MKILLIVANSSDTTMHVDAKENEVKWKCNALPSNVLGIIRTIRKHPWSYRIYVRKTCL